MLDQISYDLEGKKFCINKPPYLISLIYFKGIKIRLRISYLCHVTKKKKTVQTDSQSSLRQSGHDLYSEIRLFLFLEKCFKSQMSLDEQEMHKILIFIAVLFNASNALTFSASHSFDVLPLNIPEEESCLFQGIFIRMWCSKNYVHHNTDSFDRLKMK